MATQTVNKLEVRSYDQPDETRTPAKSKVDILNFGDVTIGRFAFEPGWSWAECIKPVVGGEHCQATHIGYCVAGELEVWHTDGTRANIKAGNSYTIPPDHDGKVVGDQPFVGIEFVGAATYAKK
jgi:quercetin dioxygenase-like cupin family protein